MATSRRPAQTYGALTLQGEATINARALTRGSDSRTGRHPRRTRWAIALALGIGSVQPASDREASAMEKRATPVETRGTSATRAAAGARDGAPASPESSADWLRRALVDHERALLERDPALVAGKFTKMAKTPFAFFRGTPWMALREESLFTTAASSQVAVTGDPHPENVGTTVDAHGVRHLEFNDFDQADFGSYLDDLRRLASGFWIVADMGKLKSKKQDEVVGEVIDGYVAEVRALSGGAQPFALTENLLGEILPAILNEPDDPLKESDPATQADKTLVREILNSYAGSLPSLKTSGAKGMLTIKRLVRRHAGVSSFPLLRFQVLVEGPTAGAPDEWILEIKESKGAPAARVIAIQKQFHAADPSDAFLGWASVGGQEFRVRRVDPSQRRISADKLAKRIRKDDLRKRDLKTLAFSLGRLLARGHCLALGRDGKPGLNAIVDAIGAKGNLKDEVVAYAGRMGTANQRDFQLLNELVAGQGPMLGWRAAAK